MTTLSRGCMRHQVRDAIVSRILEGVYPPGSRLKELALAKEFDVSQAPVREALRELEALNLVQTEHYRGTRVRSIDLAELKQAYELRQLIEQASVRRAVPAVTKDLSVLEEAIRVMQQTTPADDLETHMTAVLRFHRQLVEMSHNPLFLRVWESMAWDVRARVAVKRMGLSSASVQQSYVRRRRQIVKALRAGDGETAATLLGEITQGLLARISALEAPAARAA